MQKERYEALQFLTHEMGLHLKDAHVAAHKQVNLTEDEIYSYVKRFQTLDTDNKGFLTVSDLRRHFKVCGLRQAVVMYRLKTAFYLRHSGVVGRRISVELTCVDVAEHHNSC